MFLLFGHPRLRPPRQTMWWVSSILVLPLLALTVGSDSQATTLTVRQAQQNALASCAQTCLGQLPNNCQADQVCFCTSSVRTSYESCLSSTCSSTQDQLGELTRSFSIQRIYPRYMCISIIRVRSSQGTSQMVNNTKLPRATDPFAIKQAHYTPSPGSSSPSPSCLSR